MPAQELLSEADQLKKVSARLEVLADLHPVVTEALLTIAGTVLSTATLLEVLVATRLDHPLRPV